MAIGVHELGNMSERRIERLCNPSCSELPSFLAVEGAFGYFEGIDYLIHFGMLRFLKSYFDPLRNFLSLSSGSK